MYWYVRLMLTIWAGAVSLIRDDRIEMSTVYIATAFCRLLQTKRVIAACLLLAIMLLAPANSALASKMPKNLKLGWDGNVQLGALASFGPTDASAITARTVFTYRNNKWEHELDARLHQSNSEALVSRRDDSGEVVVDENNEPVKDLVSSTTNNRRFIGGQLRRFFTTKYYVFAIADLDMNKPANLDMSTRQIAGVGYKLYRSKNDLVSAAVGLGRKRRVEVSGESREGAIAYLGFSLRRKIRDDITLSFDLDSDFGSENRFSEVEVTLAMKLRDPVSLKLKYDARFNSTVIDPINTYDDGLESALSVNLAVDVF